MARNRKVPVAAKDTGMHISYGGGHESTVRPAAFLEHCASIRYAGGPGRDEGTNMLRNPDFVDNADGWTGRDGLPEVQRLSDLSFERLFRAWAPGRYPRLNYDTPPAVKRGFARHLALTGDRPLPPEPFVVDTARYSSRSGLSFDMRGMLDATEAAERAGRPIYYATEAAPGSTEDRRRGHGFRR